MIRRLLTTQRDQTDRRPWTWGALAKEVISVKECNREGN